VEADFNPPNIPAFAGMTTTGIHYLGVGFRRNFRVGLVVPQQIHDSTISE